MLKYLVILLGVVTVSSSYTAHGSDVHSARTASLGGAGHAGPLLNDAIFLNPGFASFLPTYSAGFNILTYSGPPITQPPPEVDPHGRDYSVSVQDCRSELFQLGVGYSKRDDGSFVHLGASKSFIQRLGFGLGSKFYFNNTNYRNGSDAILSFAGIASEWLQTSLTIDNLLQTSAGMDRNLYREFVLGTKFNVMSIVLIYCDPHLAPSNPAGSFGHETGIEFVVMQDFFLRAGAFKNATIPFEGKYGRGYGLGAGWVAPRLSLDYGMEREVEPRQNTSHVFGATAFF